MMKTNPAMQATAAYKAAMQRLEQASQSAPADQSAFADMLKSEMAGNLQKLKDSEQVALDGLAGKASVQEVVEALGAAEFSLQKVTTIRDRVISAYQEIIRMPI